MFGYPRRVFRTRFRVFGCLFESFCLLFESGSLGFEGWTVEAESLPLGFERGTRRLETRRPGAQHQHLRPDVGRVSGENQGKQPKRGICGRIDSFPGSCSSEAKARLSQQSGALVLPREPQFHKPNRLLEPGRLRGDSPDSRRTRAGHAPQITFGLPGATPDSAGRLNTVRAYGQSATGTRVLNGRGRLY